MVASGVLITWSMPFRYYLNPAFRVKMLLLLMAVLLTAWLTRRPIDAAAESPPRVATVIAWLLWLGVGFSGRLIGFL